MDRERIGGAVAVEARLESGGREGAGGTADGTARRVLRLAAEDVRRTWVSYPASCVALACVGFVTIGLTGGVLVLGGFGQGGEGLEEDFNGFLADFFFLAVCPGLGINLLFNQDYGARYRHDNMTRRLTFLRGLAVAAGEIVAGRALTMLLFFVVSVPSFFLPLLFFSAEAVGRLGVTAFWSFVAIWTSYALLTAGFYLYVWLGFSGREDLGITLALMLGYLLGAALVNFALDIHLVSGSLHLARQHGPLVAVPALASGAVGFVLWCWAATKRLQRRDLSV